jgi:hypothetical protein
VGIRSANAAMGYFDINIVLAPAFGFEVAPSHVALGRHLIISEPTLKFILIRHSVKELSSRCRECRIKRSIEIVTQYIKETKNDDDLIFDLD